MNSLGIASIVFVCTFGSALLGLLVRARLPEHHLGSETMDVVKLATGLIAAMVALILGLLTASAKSTFDQVNTQVLENAANVIQLDRLLARYGPETNGIRGQLRQALTLRLQLAWPEEGAPPTGVGVLDLTREAEGLEGAIRDLSPQTEAQNDLRTQALAISREILSTRWRTLAQASNQVPVTFLVVLIVWLCILFASFGVYATRNATVVTVLALCAFAVSGSIFLILEMNRPFDGSIKISSAPVRYALSQLGQ